MFIKVQTSIQKNPGIAIEKAYVLFKCKFIDYDLKLD